MTIPNEEHGGYHWRNGIYFKRLHDGSVQLRWGYYPDQTVHVIPPEEWASIVASVSANGENGATFDKACALHGGYRS